jgi:hypothetical protein
LNPLPLYKLHLDDGKVAADEPVSIPTRVRTKFKTVIYLELISLAWFKLQAVCADTPVESVVDGSVADRELRKYPEVHGSICRN